MKAHREQVPVGNQISILQQKPMEIVPVRTGAFDPRLDIDSETWADMKKQINRNKPIRIGKPRETSSANSAVAMHAFVSLGEFRGDTIKISREVLRKAMEHTLEDLSYSVRVGRVTTSYTLGEEIASLKLLVGNMWDISLFPHVGFGANFRGISRSRYPDARCINPLLLFYPDESLYDLAAIGETWTSTNSVDDFLKAVKSKGVDIIQSFQSGILSHTPEDISITARTLAHGKLLLASYDQETGVLPDHLWSELRKSLEAFRQRKSWDEYVQLAYYMTILGAQKAQITKDRKLNIVLEPLTSSQETTTPVPPTRRFR